MIEQLVRYCKTARPVGIGLLTGAMLAATGCNVLPTTRPDAPAGPDPSPPVAEDPSAQAVIGQLPALLLARHGTTTGFRFEPAPTSEVTIETHPRVDGEITFDNDTGILRYTPAAGDHDEFTLTLRAQGPQGPSTLGTLNVVPVAAIPAETRFIDNDRPVPKLPIYNDIRISPSKDKRWFNGVERTTRGVTVSGFEVRFDPADKHAELNRFTGSADLHRLDIEADSVIIRGTLHLPQTEVRISARRLVFEDVDPGNPARIDTSPLAWPTGAGDGNTRNTPSPGEHGLRAGDIHLVLDQLIADGGTRLVMNGGPGQDPERGRDGDDGDSVSSRTHKVNNRRFTNVVYVQTHHVQSSATVPIREPELRPNEDFSSSRHQPTNGAKGVPAGRPGDGGPGGDLVCNNPEWRRYAQQLGGTPGQAFGPYDGGAAGRPTTWRKIREKVVTTYSSNSQPLTTTWFVEEKSGRTRDGAASGTVLHGNAGAPGLVRSEGGRKTWLTTNLLRLVVERLRDVYLAGRFDHALALVREFGPLSTDLAAGSGDAGHELIALRRELNTLSHRLAAGLDYFGNPPGWVPNLSVEVNYSAFQQEIDSAIRMYYLSYWLHRHWRALEHKTEALDRLIALQQDQIESHRRRYANASALLPVLEAEQRRIDTESAYFLDKLRAREQVLAADATGNVRRRAILRTINLLGEIVVSHKKPTAYAIFASASSQDVETIFDPDSPLSSGDTVLDAYRRVTSDAEIIAIRKQLGALDPSTATDPDAYTGELLALGDRLSGATQASRDAFLKNAIGDDEVHAELQRLKAQDASFNDLVDDLTRFLAHKQLFAEKTAQAIQALETTTDEISTGWLAVDSLTRARDNWSPTPPVAVLQAIRSIREKARERLVLYQYYLAKAYEYRILEPYPGDFRKNRLFEKLASDFEAAPVGRQDDGPPELSVDGEDFNTLRTIYLDELRTVVSAIITGLNEDRPEPLEIVQTLRLTGDELARLNDSSEVAINLADRGLISDNDVNTRIVDIEVLAAQSAFVAEPAAEGRRPVSNLQITAAPAGESILRWGNSEYAFDYRRRRGVAPVRWGYTWDAITGTGRQIQRSDDSLSLLTRLLDDGASAPVNQARIRFLPGARGDIVLRKEVRPVVEGEDIRIQDLALAIRLQLYKTYQSRTLSLQADHGVTIAVSQSDLTGRANGRDRFHRFYSPGQQVTVTVPPQVGEYRFSGWYDAAGRQVGSKPGLAVTVDQHLSRRAQYTAPDRL